MTIFWLAVVAVMLVIEIFTMGLTTIWFSLGAAASAAVSALGGPVWLQIVLFCAISVLVMLLVRPFAVKVLDKNRTRTNVDEYVGQTVQVIETIDNGKETGHVRLRGMEWLARSAEDDTVIYEGENALVRSVSGVKLIVEKIEKL